MDEKTLYLIDGHSLTFKAYYAIRNLRGPRGAPTGAIYGFLRMLLKFIGEWSPAYLAVVFDTGKPSFRKAMFEAYKANREAPPPDFSDQMRGIYQLLKAMGIATYELETFEADDIIATMAEQMKERHGQAVVLTADKDLLQLVDGCVTVLRPGLNEIKRCDAAAVLEVLGVRPDQVVDWLALVGDSSDNIPGVPGIGEKSAVELLGQFGTLDALLERAAEIKKPKQRQSLLDNIERARLARQLATVRRDVPVAWDLDACRLPEDLWNPQTVALLAEFGFDSLIREKGLKPPAPAAAPAPPRIPAKPGETAQDDLFADFAEPTAPAVPAPEVPAAAVATSPAPAVAPAEVVDYRAITDAAALEAWVAEAMAAPWLALDTETTSTDVMNADLVGISLSFKPGSAIYIPVGHQADLMNIVQLELPVVRQTLSALLGGQGPRLTAHHAKFDWKMLTLAGFTMAPPAFDTMLASYLLDPDKASGHGLKVLGRELCDVAMNPIKDLIGSGKKQITMAEVPIADAAIYAARDADVTLRLTECLRPRLEAEPALQSLLDTMELPLAMVLMQMELGGFTIDVEVLRGLGLQVDAQLGVLAEQIWAETGHPFNIGSPRQVAEVLYKEQGLKPGKQGKTGYSTDESELERLAPLHNIPRLILEYRGYEKLKSTYIDALPKLVHSQTGRIHTSFNQTVAATGRLSSTEPNLQNIPIRTELGRAIRRAFVADSTGHALLKADYSQIELRILAHVTRDPALCSAYQEGQDIHRQTASEVFGVQPAEVTSQMRAQAKVINFGIIYGMSAHGLAQQLGIGRQQAARFIERYFQTYPAVQAWFQRLLERARLTGYVETLLGRRRLVPDLTAANGMLRSNAERVAINAPIQGTCADMIKLAMITIQRGLEGVAPGARMVCQVHDELVFSIPRPLLEPATDFIRRGMVEALRLSVPIEVDIKHAPNWAEC